MQKKLTITIDEKVYEGLRRVIGRGNICLYIESVVGPLILKEDLSAAYALMAQDQTREREALDWSESLVSGVAREAG